MPIAATMETLAAAMRGHYNYYGVSGNSKKVMEFYRYLWWTTYRMLNRRDQKGKLSTAKFSRIWNHYMEGPRVKVNIWDWEPKTV